MASVTEPSESRAVFPEQESLRLLLSDEATQLADHLLRLDPLSRFMRFGGQISDTAVRRHAARAVKEARLIGYFADGVLRGIAELHPIPPRPGKRPSAEIAFSVERPWQGHGIGARLMDRIVAHARAHGFENLHLIFLSGNGRMKRLAVQSGVVLTDDEDQIIGSLRARPATPFTWAREAMRGCGGAAEAAFAAPRRLFAPVGSKS